MRIPIAKIYRAFPELDRFSDVHCRYYVDLAKRRHVPSGILAALGALASFFAWLALYAYLGGPILHWLLSAIAPSSARGLGVVFFHLLAAVGGGAVCGFLVRDYWLRWAIRQHLSLGRCVACGYSLLGLPIEAGVVKCPECGRAMALAEFGLVPADLLASPAPATGT